MASSALDGPSSRLDRVTRVRLRVDVYDALARARGYDSVAAQAAWHGISTAQMWNLRRHRSVPGLATAMRMARDLGVAVEVIWEQVTEPVITEPVTP